MRHAALALPLFLSLASTAFGETTEYGSFRHYSDLPFGLVLIGEIKSGDSFELRRAMRDHEISLVVTASAGGNLYEGLQMAAILHDKGINTYVPPDVNCESSCANIFFGGAKRIVLGNLGVHQFYSTNNGAETPAPSDVTTSVAQYTTSEIIGIMNEFGTPPFVYEKMFGTNDIYYFKDAEKLKINEGADDDAFVAELASVDSFIALNPNAVQRPSPTTPDVPAPQASTDTPAPEAANPQSGQISQFQNIDFFGRDISPTGVRGISLAECENICRSDASCAAYSYVAKTQWCWPKYGVTNVSLAAGTISGIKDYAKVDPTIFDRPFVEATGSDIAGYDLFPRGLKNMSLDQCRMTCEATTSCVAFSWVAKKEWCFPKYGVGQIIDALGTISGVRK